jgi:uncharacterized protein YgbK (DUF1537 family)
VVNAASYRDLEVFVLGLLAAEARGKKFLFRTAASFVQVRSGLCPRPLLTQSDLELTHAGGGLIVVGSYVPRSTDQVNSLLSNTDILHTEINVAGYLTISFAKMRSVGWSKKWIRHCTKVTTSLFSPAAN